MLSIMKKALFFLLKHLGVERFIRARTSRDDAKQRWESIEEFIGVFFKIPLPCALEFPDFPRLGIDPYRMDGSFPYAMRKRAKEIRGLLTMNKRPVVQPKQRPSSA